MEAPDNIYLFRNPNGIILGTWFLDSNEQYGSIEYTRTDAFIERVARYLEYKLNDRVEIQVDGTLIPSLTSKEAFIEEFINYMKGE